MALLEKHRESLLKLVERHRQFQDEPLLLAIAYQSERFPNDIFLFEIIDRFGLNDVSPDKHLFEIRYDSSPNFPLYGDEKLHMILTNKVEYGKAAEEEWEIIQELSEAVSSGKAELLYHDRERLPNPMLTLPAPAPLRRPAA